MYTALNFIGPRRDAAFERSRQNGPKGEEGAIGTDGKSNQHECIGGNGDVGISPAGLIIEQG